MKEKEMDIKNKGHDNFLSAQNLTTLIMKSTALFWPNYAKTSTVETKVKVRSVGNVKMRQFEKTSLENPRAFYLRRHSSR